MILTTVFLSNLLCTFFNCQYLRDPPVTTTDNSTIEKFALERTGRSFNALPKPIVNTTLGKVEGYYLGVMTRTVFAFEGIPYAEDPVGNLRFRDPVPRRPWAPAVRSAKKISAECLQFNLPRFLRVLGKEGCLELNVYTPYIATPEFNPKLPVMIFIHGGSFIYGRASDFGPAYLLQENIILVTINYRLGVLGFLSTGDQEAPGNWGLKDQALAIKFVYDNIENFGGDKTKITISGQSAGAACVHLHMCSHTSVATGLFRSAISFSGSAAHHWALQTPEFARKLTHNFAKRLGCPTDQGSKILMDCLRRIEPNFLVAGQNNLIEYAGFPAVLFAPVIEPSYANGAFLTESAEEAYANGHVQKIPFLATNTAEEGEYVLMVMKNFLVLGHIIRNWEKRAPLILDIRDYVEDPGKAALELRDTYIPSEYRTSIIDSNVKRYAQIGTDRYFTLGNRRALKLHNDVAPTYSYILRFKSRFGVAPFLFTDFREWGASHGEDMTLLFNNTAFSDPMKPEDKAYDVSKKLISLITNFVTHQVPYLTDSTNGSLVEVWKPIGDPDYPMFLEISENGLNMIKDPMHGTEEMKVWQRLGIK